MVVGPERMKLDDAAEGRPEEQHTLDAEIDFLAPAEQPDEIGRLGGCRVLDVLGIGAWASSSALRTPNSNVRARSRQ